MKAELGVLLEILDEQKALQSALVELSGRKTQAISAGRTDDLSAIVEQERSILVQIKAVEKKQSRCVEKLAALLGLPAAEVRMSLIIERAEGDQKESLMRVREELSALIEQQIKSNEST